MKRLPRCPNGFRRDKKSGECVPNAKKVSVPKGIAEKYNSYDKGYKALKYENVYSQYYKNKNVNIQNLIRNKPQVFKNGLYEFLENVKSDVRKNKEMENMEHKIKSKLKLKEKEVPKFKIKSKLRPIVNKVVKKKDLSKINKMKNENINENAYKFIVIDGYVQSNHEFFVIYKWLTNKYKDVMNSRVYNVQVEMSGSSINQKVMKQCLDSHAQVYMRKMGYCQMNGLVNYAKYANEAKKQNKKYYITSLSILKVTRKSSHKNALIHDLDTNEIYRFEPHGSGSNFTNHNLDRFIKTNILKSYKKYNIKPLPTYKLNMMPYNGPQALDTWGKGYGRCAIWTLAFLHYRLQYTHLTENQIFRFMGRTPAEAVHFIKRYMTYLKNHTKVFELYDTKEFKKQIKEDTLYTI